MSEKTPYLSEIEHDSIVRFNNDVIQKEAVRKVILSIIYQGTLKPGEPSDMFKNFALNLSRVTEIDGPATNERIGENMKAIWKGMEMLNQGFKQLDEFKPKVVEKPPEVNVAL